MARLSGLPAVRRRRLARRRRGYPPRQPGGAPELRRRRLERKGERGETRPAAERVAGGWRRRQAARRPAGHTAERERSGGPGFHGPGCPDGSAKAERQAEWRGGASGRRLTQAAREATAGCPPKRDERGVRASAKVPRTGARRRGTRGAAGSGAGASARALDKAAASRMREVTWDTCLSASPPVRSFRNPRPRRPVILETSLYIFPRKKAWRTKPDRRALILAFSHQGFTGVGLRPRSAGVSPAEPRLRAARPHPSPLP